MDDAFLLSHGFPERFEHVVRVGPKYGIVPLVVTHSLLRGDFNGSSVLRGLLAAGNFVAFHNPNKSEGETINGVEVKPYELPTGGGYLYSVRSGGSAMARSYRGDPTERNIVADQIRQAIGDADTALAFEPLKELGSGDPVAALEQARQAMEEWREARRSGTTTTVRTPAADMAAALSAWPGVADLLQETLGKPLTLIRGGKTDDERKLTEAHLKTLAALPAKLGQLPYGETYNRSNIKELIEWGLAEQPKALGPYQRTRAGDRAIGIEAAADTNEPEESHVAAAN
jgi:hypothetical protein